MKSAHLSSAKNILVKYHETKSKEETNKMKPRKSKKKAYRRQKVQDRSWWKQRNIKIVMGEDHASCWVHKDLIGTKTK